MSFPVPPAVAAADKARPAPQVTPGPSSSYSTVPDEAAIRHGNRSAMDWASSSAALAVVSRARIADFIWHRSVRITHDDMQWQPLTDAASAILNALDLIREQALIEELGCAFEAIDWQSPDGAALANRWIERAAQVPTPSEALEAHFARIEGRCAHKEFRPTLAQTEAFREAVGAGLGSQFGSALRRVV